MPEADYIKKKTHLYKEKIVFVALIVLSFLTFFFPYRVKQTFGGSYTSLFGTVGNSSYSVEKISGFEFYLPMIAIVFLVTIALIILYSEKKSFKIIAGVMLFFYLLFLLFLYVALTFYLNFSNQRIEVEVGIGYVLLVIFSILFTIYSLVVIIKTWNGLKRPTGALSDLLDDI
jgi:hypothetical protein